MPYQIEGLGWLPDPPSQQDYCIESQQVQHLLGNFQGLAGMEGMGTSAPRSAELSRYLSSNNDQLNMGMCTGEGGVSYMEFLLKKKYGMDNVKLSPRFLYKMTRYLMGPLYEFNDTGAFIRTMLAAASTYGVPPWNYWPTIRKDDARNEWNDNPHPLSLPLAQQYKIKEHLRLDTVNSLPNEVLNRIRATIAVDENPVVFGFTCFASLNERRTQETGEIPFRYKEGPSIGGHCVLCYGYDDEMQIGNSRGAIRIKNSWGTNWGIKGNGWLPYDYILTGNAADFWTILDLNKMDRKAYGL